MNKWTTKSGYAIHKILGFRCNVFLVSHDKHHFLIDCGSKSFRNPLMRNLNKLGINHLDGLILTHSHFDHAGNSLFIRNKFSCPVIIHSAEANYLATGCSPLPHGTNPITKFLINSLNGKLPVWAQYEPCMPDIVISENYTLAEQGFEAYLMPTPGHSPGSTSLILDNEIAITGDAMFGIFPGSVFPPFADNVKQLIQSWELLLETGASIFLPSHGQSRQNSTLKLQLEKYKQRCQ